MTVQFKVLMMVVGVYLVGLYIFRFFLALSQGEFDDDDDMVSYWWPLALHFWFLDWLYIRIVRVCHKIPFPFNTSMHYLGICLYWMFLLFRPAELGKVLHCCLKKGDAPKKQNDIIVDCSPSMSGWNCEVCGKRQEKGSECWHNMNTKKYFCGGCAKMLNLRRLGTVAEIRKELKEGTTR